MGDAGFWADAERARKAVEEVKQLKRWVDPYRALQKRVRDELELAELHEAEPVADATLEQLQQQNLSELDRKSTRLNSSHSQISYAVFCLTKKILNPTAQRIISGRRCAIPNPLLS